MSASFSGQEQRIIPGAEHTACTIEMLDTNNRIDVAVMDEVQVGSLLCREAFHQLSYIYECS